jgi:hypothetical protein
MAVFFLVVIVLGMSFLVMYALNRDRWLESARRSRRDAGMIEQSKRLERDEQV